MRTNIVIDEKLMAEVMAQTGIKTKREAVDEALRALLKFQLKQKLLNMRGKVEFWEGYDYKEMRKS